MLLRSLLRVVLLVVTVVIADLVVILANAVDAGVPSITVKTATLPTLARQRRQRAIKATTTTRVAPITTQLANKGLGPTIHVQFTSPISQL